jgi:hypothetical protein
LVYDLIAKIWPESDSVYDLTAIDTRYDECVSVLRQKPVAGMDGIDIADLCRADNTIDF